MATALVYVGIRGTVVALDSATGTKMWATELKGSDFVNVTATAAGVLAITKGEIFCLEPSTGTVRWHNPLQGLGRGLATVAGSADSGATAAAEKRRRDEAAAAAAAAGS